MGATPLFALSIVGFPSGRLPMEVLERILLGARDTAERAGISIVGGHTIDDPEPKFGLAVTGSVHPDRILANRGGRAGDALVLTKPLGVGVLTTALKRGFLDDDETRRLQDTMAELNATAAEVIRRHPVHALTDVTGFGLLGHLREMIATTEVDAVIDAARLPLLPRAEEMATGGTVPGGTENNREYVAPFVSFDAAVPEPLRVLACDAQTSGGLLAAIPAGAAGDCVAALREAGVVGATAIGELRGGGSGLVEVVFRSGNRDTLES